MAVMTTGVSRTALVAVSFMLAAGCTGSTSLTGQKTTAQSSTGARAPSSQKAHVGQSLRVTGDGGLVASVTLTGVKAYRKASGPLGAVTPANGVFEVAHITIAVTAGSYDYNVLYFKWVSAAGNTYDFTQGKADEAQFDPALSSGTLSAGQRGGGNVVFDVPAGAGTVQLTDPLDAVIGEWNA